MKYGTQISENLKDIERLLRGNQYSKALLIVNKLLEEYPFSTRLLLLKGRLVQLLDEESELGELQDALDALELASELDDCSIDALNELAMFRHVVEDKHDEAMLLFEKSIAKCFELLEEAYLGKAKCLFETDRVFESLNCLNEGFQVIPHAAKLKAEKDYILSIVQGVEK